MNELFAQGEEVKHEDLPDAFGNEEVSVEADAESSEVDKFELEETETQDSNLVVMDYECETQTSESVECCDTTDVEQEVPGDSPTVNEGAKDETESYDLADELNKLAETVFGLSTLFEKKMLIDAQKNRIIETQGDELQRHREGMYEKILKPLLVDIIDVALDMQRLLRAYVDKAEETITVTKFVSIMETYESDLEDVLEKYGVVAYSCPEEVFDPRKQKIVKIMQTDDESNNKHISERITRGYEMSGYVIRPERVNVYKYQVSEPVNDKPEE